ncbi:MAG TPA: hypothetical protein VF834_05040 [Streptosporangiaceae bacterium]
MRADQQVAGLDQVAVALGSQAAGARVLGLEVVRDRDRETAAALILVVGTPTSRAAPMRALLAGDRVWSVVAQEPASS